MNIPSNIAKSFLLASAIFGGIIMVTEYEPDLFPFFFIAMIPIFMVVTMVILGTVCPFFWLAKSATVNERRIFQIYYPFYAIIVFSVCAWGIISSHFDNFAIAFFSSAFITTSQSWVWFAKTTEE